MKQKDILFLLIPTFIIILMWIVFNIYHNLMTSTIPETLNIQISPINSNFDVKTIEKLKKRKKIEPLYELLNNALSQNSATPSSKPTQLTAYPSLSPSPTSQILNNSKQTPQEGL